MKNVILVNDFCSLTNEQKKKYNETVTSFEQNKKFKQFELTHSEDLKLA